MTNSHNIGNLTTAIKELLLEGMTEEEIATAVCDVMNDFSPEEEETLNAIDEIEYDMMRNAIGDSLKNSIEKYGIAVREYIDEENYDTFDALAELILDDIALAHPETWFVKTQGEVETAKEFILQILRTLQDNLRYWVIPENNTKLTIAATSSSETSNETAATSIQPSANRITHSLEQSHTEVNKPVCRAGLDGVEAKKPACCGERAKVGVVDEACVDSCECHHTEAPASVPSLFELLGITREDIDAACEAAKQAMYRSLDKAD